MADTNGGGKTVVKFGLKLGPKSKLVLILLATYGLQVAWVQMTTSAVLTPQEWGTDWWNRISAVARWLQVQWQNRGTP
jgi:hypothetical protein